MVQELIFRVQGFGPDLGLGVQWHAKYSDSE